MPRSPQPLLDLSLGGRYQQTMVEPPRSARPREAEIAEGPQVALILSSGRTGTQFLAHYLHARFDRVQARHEPPGSRLIRLVSHAALEARISRTHAQHLLERHARRQLASVSPGDRYIESNPYLAGVAELADAAFGRPRVAHIVRDPRAAVRSSLNHGNASGWKGFANRAIPFWFPKVERLTSLAPGASPIGRAAAWWEVANERIETALAASPRYRRFRFEDLFADRQGRSLEPLLAHLGLDPLEAPERGAARPINASRLDVWRPWQEWPETWSRELHAICAKRMAAYGYGDEPEWLERVSR